MATETITVMFTDLVDSTALASRVGEEHAETLRREHFALLRDVISETGGREIKNLGDGVMAVFGSSDAAADAAVRIQQRLESRNRTADDALLVRIGIALGNADAEDNDYFGPPVVEASRLCTAATGGQILTSDIVRTLTGSRGGHEFEPVGELDLKGLDAPLRACSITWQPEASTSLDAEVPLPTRLRRDRAAGFVGRASERVKLFDALKSAATEQQSRVVLIGGEPGIGKTTLAAEVARFAHDAGATVLYGRSDEDVGIPYQPWIEALGHLAEFAPDDVIDRYSAAHGDELVPLAPTLVHRRPDLRAMRTGDPDTDRHLLFGAVNALLRAAATDEPVVVVLDDLHWADKPTLLLLRHLASSAEYATVVIGTFRESEVDVGDALADTLAALHREPRVERISLRGLEDVELIELMEARAGHEMTDEGVALAHALRRETDGNPFFVGEMLLHLAETGAIYQQDGRWVGRDDLRTSGLPVSVREVIGRRVARLGETTVRTLSVAAVIGRDFDAALVARTAPVDEDDLADLLDRAVDAALIEEVPNVPGRYTFVHALIEHTLYDGLSANRRARVHRQVAEALEELYASDPGDRIGELAYHWMEATAPQDARKTIEYVRRAAERAQEQVAPDEALRWFGQAVELYERAGLADEPLRCELLVGLGLSQLQVGTGRWRATLLEAALLAKELGEVDLLVEAALGTRGGASDVRGIDREWVEVVEAALEATDSDADRGRLLAVLAAELTFGEDFSRRLALADEALSCARRANDPEALAFVLARRVVTVPVPSLLDDNERKVEELAELVDVLGDPILKTNVEGDRGVCALLRGDADEAVRIWQARSDFVTTRLGVPGHRFGAMVPASVMALLPGDLAAGEKVADDVLQLGADTGMPDVLAFYGAMLIAVRWHQGRLAELEPIIAQVAAETPGVPAFIAELAHSRIEGGDAEGAAELLAAAAADGFASVPYDGVWTTTLVLWAEIATYLDATEPAAALLDLLRPYPDQVAFNGVSTFGPIADYLGMLATVLGQYDEAERYFDDAMAMHERFKAPFFRARTYLHRAQLCARRGARTDAAEAHALLASALAIADQFGYAGIEREVATLGG